MGARRWLKVINALTRSLGVVDLYLIETISHIT